VERFEERVRDWNIVVQDTLETQSSLVAFGTRGNLPVVLKVVRQPGDEWRCGDVLSAFDGRGVVRVYDHIEGAVLLERLSPGTALASLALDGRDDEATEILAEVIQRMSSTIESSGETLRKFATIQDWGRAFQGYLESGDKQIPDDLVERGQHLYLKLCASQRDTRLLHGDLQHYNVLLDNDRGWVAIDPKGVVGEVEYEIGASLRNPCERPDLFVTAETVERRLKIYEEKLKLDSDRASGWVFAQAVLSAIWSVEDGFEVDCNNHAIRLANAMVPLLS
jgi:streptomycin 6-kinase